MDLKISRLNIIIVVAFVILSACICFIFFAPIFNPDRPGMSITKINESGVPDGPVVRIADEDFREFPFLAPVIRDNSQHGISTNDGKRISYVVGLSWQDKDRISGSKFFSHHNTFFEYEGTYYSFVHSWPDSNMTITKINESGIPDGYVVRITEDDFKEFPYLVPIIQNNSPNGISHDNGTRIDHYLELSGREKDKMWDSKFFLRREVYFEYKGIYYYFTPPWIP